MSALWAGEEFSEKIPDVPDLFPIFEFAGRYPWGHEIKLVNLGLKRFTRSILLKGIEICP